MAVDKDGDRVGLSALLDEYQEHKKIYRFEGDSGLKNLETLLTDMGYPGHQFRFGSPIESFLSDNPGAVEALLDWAREQDADEWCDNIESCLPERCEEAEEEGCEEAEEEGCEEAE